MVHGALRVHFLEDEWSCMCMCMCVRVRVRVRERKSQGSVVLLARSRTLVRLGQVAQVAVLLAAVVDWLTLEQGRWRGQQGDRRDWQSMLGMTAVRGVAGVHLLPVLLLLLLLLLLLHTESSPSAVL